MEHRLTVRGIFAITSDFFAQFLFEKVDFKPKSAKLKPIPNHYKLSFETVALDSHAMVPRSQPWALGPRGPWARAEGERQDPLLSSMAMLLRDPVLPRSLGGSCIPLFKEGRNSSHAWLPAPACHFAIAF